MNKTWKPTTAGILSIISGASGILFGLIRMARVGNGRHVLGLFLLIMGIVAVAGGIVSLLRKAWGLGLAGAICAIFSPGFVLGILATIFVSISKDEFDRPAQAMNPKP